MHKRLVCWWVVLCFPLLVLGQDTTNHAVARKHVPWVASASAVTYTGSMVALNYAWYADYPRSNFHFFNDNNEWLLMDKIGHFYSGVRITDYTTHVWRWAGVSNKKAVWFGAGSAMLALTSIEVYDGLSSQWGFSWGDMIANTVGVAAAGTQEYFWQEQKINFKFSFHNTKYAQYRPNLLGKSGWERWLKDYNGQTQWVSFSPAAFYNRDTKWPKWLCFSIGYGAEGMIGAHTNPTEVNGQPVPSFTRYRQYYLSLDVNLSTIKTKSKALNTVFHIFNAIKVPFPTLEFNRVDGVKGHWLYF